MPSQFDSLKSVLSLEHFPLNRSRYCISNEQAKEMSTYDMSNMFDYPAQAPYCITPSFWRQPMNFIIIIPLCRQIYHHTRPGANQDVFSVTYYSHDTIYIRVTMWCKESGRPISRSSKCVRFLYRGRGNEFSKYHIIITGADWCVVRGIEANRSHVMLSMVLSLSLIHI